MNSVIHKDGDPLRKFMGAENRFRRQHIDIVCEGKARRIGSLRFGKDGSFYFFRKGKTPIAEMGSAVLKDGSLIKTDSADLSSVPLEKRRGVHVSLHPSGQIHVKAAQYEPLTIGNIGPWLPVQRTFVFAYVYTEPVGNLAIAKKSNAIWTARDSKKSLKLDILISPMVNVYGSIKLVRDAKCKPILTDRPSTVYIGLSPRYQVFVNITLIPACVGQFYFLASPDKANPNRK